MYDKRKEFEKINIKLDEIRKLCNRAGIPFVFVAAVYDDNEKTKYASYIDANNEGDGRDTEGYVCNGLSPRSLGYEFTDVDNRIVQIARIMNGEVAVPPSGKAARQNFEVIEEMSSKLGDAFHAMYNIDSEGMVADEEPTDDTDMDDLIEDFDDEF